MKRQIILMLTLFSIISCENQPTSSLILCDRNIEMKLNEKYEIFVNKEYIDKAISYISSDDCVFTIDEQNTIIPVNFGTATLIAIVENEYDEIPVVIKNSYIVAGVIRRVEPASWYAIDDDGHKPIGISKVYENTNYITIEYDFTADKINTFSVTTDESFAAEGIFSGASVGTSIARIYLYKNIDGVMTQIDPTIINNPSANLWIYGIFEIEK